MPFPNVFRKVLRKVTPKFDVFPKVTIPQISTTTRTLTYKEDLARSSVKSLIYAHYDSSTFKTISSKTMGYNDGIVYTRIVATIHRNIPK